MIQRTWDFSIDSKHLGSSPMQVVRKMVEQFGNAVVNDVRHELIIKKNLNKKFIKFFQF